MTGPEHRWRKRATEPLWRSNIRARKEIRRARREMQHVREVNQRIAAFAAKHYQPTPFYESVACTYEPLGQNADIRA